MKYFFIFLFLISPLHGKEIMEFKLTDAAQIIQVIKEMDRDVSIATVSFSSSNVLLFTGAGELLGYIASTATANTYIDFRTTGTIIGYETTDTKVSIHLSTGVEGTTYKFPFALSTTSGWAAKVNVNTVRFISYIYRKFPSE